MTNMVTIEQLTAERNRAEQQMAEYAAESLRLGEQANHLAQQLNAARAARERIAEAHSKHYDGHGATSGDCNECGHTHPCPTYVWATTDRDPLAPWDPADDNTSLGKMGDALARNLNAARAARARWQTESR